MNKLTQIFFLFLIFENSVIFSQKTNTEISGDIIYVSLPAIALGSTCFYQADDKPHWQFIKTYALANLITHSLKPIINEKRPNGGQHSFPSGHSTSAFAGAAFLQMRYGWKVGIPAYLLASYVGFTRIYAKKHYIWDVAAGALIGIGSAMIFTKKLPENYQSSMNYNNGFYMIGINYNF